MHKAKFILVALVLLTVLGFALAPSKSKVAVSDANHLVQKKGEIIGLPMEDQNQFD